MSMEIPTTKEIADSNLYNFEKELNQEAPLNDKAFLRVLSGVEALQIASLYRFIVERSLQNLASTASGEDLSRIGESIGIFRKASIPAILDAEIQGSDGVIIPQGTEFIGQINGLVYLTDNNQTIAAGIATLTLTAKLPGTSGNLGVGEILNISTQIAGANSLATISEIIQIGTEEESEEGYRARVLRRQQAKPQGGAAADYQAWGEEVEGVAHIYPYAGDVAGDTSIPGQRTIFVEAEVSINTDGIAPQTLLDEVRESIIYDQNGRATRQPLGLPSDLLFVVSITRTSVFVRIINMEVDSGLVSSTQAKISLALDELFRSMSPFIGGITFGTRQVGVITDPLVSDVVQDIITEAGGTVEQVQFQIPSGTTLDVYQLDRGELAKLGGVTYVTV